LSSVDFIIVKCAKCGHKGIFKDFFQVNVGVHRNEGQYAYLCKPCKELWIQYLSDKHTAKDWLTRNNSWFKAWDGFLRRGAFVFR